MGNAQVFRKDLIELFNQLVPVEVLVVMQSQKLYENWKAFKRVEKRSIIESITNSIEFDGKTLNFKLKLALNG